MEDWKLIAIGRLKEHSAKQKALETIPIQITALETAKTDALGSGKKNEALNCIVQAEELQRNLDRVKLWCTLVDKGLSVLDWEERYILDRFYITGRHRAAEKIAEELSVDVRTIQQWKDAALRKFTIALYGCVES